MRYSGRPVLGRSCFRLGSPYGLEQGQPVLSDHTLDPRGLPTLRSIVEVMFGSAAVGLRKFVADRPKRKSLKLMAVFEVNASSNQLKNKIPMPRLLDLRQLRLSLYRRGGCRLLEYRLSPVRQGAAAPGVGCEGRCDKVWSLVRGSLRGAHSSRLSSTE